MGIGFSTDPHSSCRTQPFEWKIGFALLLTEQPSSWFWWYFGELGFFLVCFAFRFDWFYGLVWVFFFHPEELLQGQVFRRAQKCDMTKTHSCGQKQVLILIFFCCCIVMASEVFSNAACGKTSPLLPKYTLMSSFILVTGFSWVHNSI